MLALLRENLGRLVEEKGSSLRKVSTEAGLGTSFLRDVMDGQNPSITKIAKIAQKHEVSIDSLLGLSPQRTAREEPIRVLGEVGAGQWHQLDGIAQLDFVQEDSPFPPDPRYPVGAQFDLVVRGTSINRFAQDGMRLRCVDLTAGDIPDVRDDDMVVVRRTKADGLVQTTAKRVRKLGPIYELWPDSTDPKWQTPERIDSRRNSDDGEEARIIALVLYSYMPANNRRR